MFFLLIPVAIDRDSFQLPPEQPVTLARQKERRKKDCFVSY
jgi:hypothetical protein